MLCQHSRKSQSDLQQLGYVMIKLMQPGTSLRNPTTQELEQPHNWGENIQLFLKNMFCFSLNVLLKVTSQIFTPDSPTDDLIFFS